MFLIWQIYIQTLAPLFFLYSIQLQSRALLELYSDHQRMWLVTSSRQRREYDCDDYWGVFLYSSNYFSKSQIELSNCAPSRSPKRRVWRHLNIIKGQKHFKHLCSSCKSFLTSFRDIVQRVADAVIIIGFFHPADAMAVRDQFEEIDIMSGPSTEPDSCVWCVQAVTGSILRGVGKQRIGAVCNLVGYYCIGIPIGLSLMFAAKMGIVGEDAAL